MTPYLHKGGLTKLGVSQHRCEHLCSHVFFLFVKHFAGYIDIHTHFNIMDYFVHIIPAMPISVSGYNTTKCGKVLG